MRVSFDKYPQLLKKERELRESQNNKIHDLKQKLEDNEKNLQNINAKVEKLESINDRWKESAINKCDLIHGIHASLKVII